MRYTKLLCLFSLAAFGFAYAQTPRHQTEDHITGSDKGTLACKTEAAMVQIMKTMIPPTYLINKQVMDELIKKDDCLIMPTGWVVLLQKDPPLDQQEDHASQWTVRTPHGTVHMWGTPMGGD